jgi:signal transduction histidine kinase
MSAPSYSDALSQAVAQGPTVIYSADTNGNGFRITYASDNLDALVGCSPAQVCADPSFWLERVHPEDIARVREELACPPSPSATVSEYRFQGDGGWRWLRDHRRWAEDGTIAGAWIDITAHREAAMTSLAGEFAHDISQPLTIIRLFAESLAMRLRDGDFAVPYALKRLDGIIGEVDRLRMQVERLRGKTS